MTPARWVAQAALAAEAPPVASSALIVTGGGVTLHSINLSFPNSNSIFPGAGAEAINNDCLICHSAAMVLDQANLSRAEWQNIVDQMRNDFKAPFAAGDTPAIVDYLVSIRGPNSTAAGKQNTSRQGDPNHGAVIAAQGIGSDVPACAQCHAFNGSSDGSGAFPRIADQSTYYLAKQLRDFASGVRANAIMSPIRQGARRHESRPHTRGKVAQLRGKIIGRLAGEPGNAPLASETPLSVALGTGRTLAAVPCATITAPRLGPGWRPALCAMNALAGWRGSRRSPGRSPRERGLKSLRTWSTMPCLAARDRVAWVERHAGRVADQAVVDGSVCLGAARERCCRAGEVECQPMQGRAAARNDRGQAGWVERAQPGPTERPTQLVSRSPGGSRRPRRRRRGNRIG